MAQKNLPWWKKGVVYQVFLPSFLDTDGNGTGDLQGLIRKLDYLQDLGIDIVWLTPIYDSPRIDMGYDVRDHRKIDPLFGTMADFEALVAGLHERGMRLVLDLPLNHTSDEHVWFQQSRSSHENPYRDFYIWRDGKAPGQPPNRWKSNFGGSAWEYDPTTDQYYLHLFHSKQPDLNWDNPQVRSALHDVLRFWIAKGVDGFRLDAIFVISKDQRFPEGIPLQDSPFTWGGPHYRNGPHIHTYLRELYSTVFSPYDDILMAGEAEEVTPHEAKVLTRPENHELDLVLPFEQVQADEKKGDKWTWKAVDVNKLKAVFASWHEDEADEGWFGLYWTTHDQSRIVSRYGNDQEYRVKSAKMLAACLAFMRATLFLYQGEEIGMTNVPFTDLADFPDIETQRAYAEKKAIGWDEGRLLAALRRKARDNARTPMQWDATANAGFTSGSPWMRLNPNYPDINVAATLDDPDSIYYFYQKFLHLRQRREMILTGGFRLIYAEDDRLLAYLRTGEQSTLAVLCNFTDQQVPLPADEQPFSLQEEHLLLTNRESEAPHPTWLEPYEVAVYEWPASI